MLKICKRCGECKPFSDFHKAPAGKFKLQSYCKQCKKEYTRDTGANILPSIRQRARKQGVPFSLTKENPPPIPEVCPVLGIPLRRTLGFADDNSPSLDRLIPELGYVPGNVEWMSYRANRIKNDSTYEELERVTAWVRERVSTTHPM
ncbi:restriction endonuclease [Ralstonia phage vRsoP-WM2]|nr:restriction endonuclease [Ralstonia phage vRsoP-WM2]